MFYVVVCHHQKGEIVSVEVELRQIKGDLTKYHVFDVTNQVYV